MSRPSCPWWVPPAALLGAGLLRAWGATWRVLIRREEPFQTPVIYVLWHARLLALTWLHRGEGAAVLISRNTDGEIVARLAGHLGYRTARGSSSRGAAAGLLELGDHARAGRTLAITPDGPRGPARRFKPGAIHLACSSGLPIVPVGMAARRARVLRSWDGFVLPAPFTRIGVVYGAPLRVPSDLGSTDLEAWCARAGAELDRVTDAAAALAGAPA